MNVTKRPFHQSGFANTPPTHDGKRSRSIVSGYITTLLIALLAVPFVGSRPAHGQVSTASIRGTVHDPQGAVIPQTTLTLVNVNTKVQSVRTTSGLGTYLFLNILPGTYTLEAKATGFAAQKLDPFILQVNQTSTLDFKLSLGNVQQVVQVQAIGQGLEASTTEMSLTLDSQQVADLPLNSRNFTGLFTTVPGVSPHMAASSQAALYTKVIGPVLIPAFNGQTNRSNLFLLDGISDSETFGGAYVVPPIIDSVQDIKMQSHNDSAEFGGSTGGTINVATKSGTNQFHGNLWEFNQNSHLNAHSYFSPTMSPVSQNQFGGSIGGPVILPKLYHGRNKTFFYFAYEGYQYTSPSIGYLLVPTAAQYAGDFSGENPIYDPASTTCNTAGVCSRTAFAGNQIPADRLNAGDIYYAQHTLPAATGTYLGIYNAVEDTSTHSSMHTYDARIDDTIDSKDSAFFRITLESGTSTSNRTPVSSISSPYAYQYAGSWVHIFSPNSVLHVEGGRTFENLPSLTRFNSALPSGFNAKVGFPSGLTDGYVTLGTIVPGFTVSNYWSVGGESGGPQVTADGWSGKVDYTYVRGRHTIKVGAGFDKIGATQDIQLGLITMTANETSNIASPGTTGDALASFMLGVPNSYEKRNVAESMRFGGVFGTYIQDQFQASNNLTLNYGLRYDLTIIPKYGRYKDGNEYVGNLNFNDGNYVVYKVPPSCAVTGTAPCIPTPDGALPAHVVASPNGNTLMKDTPLNLQPRIGVVYRATPTTAIRAGFGIVFDNYAAVIQNARGIAGNWPSLGLLEQENLNNPTIENPFPGNTTQNLPAIAAVPQANPFSLQAYNIDPNIKNAYSLQWNLGIQRQLSASTVVTATYVGSGNRRINVGVPYWNVAITPGPGTPSLRSPYPYIAPTHWARSIGTSSYNALEMQLNRRLSHGLAATVAYTWSKSIDLGCSGFFGTEGCSIQNVYDLEADRSVSAFDTPQALTVTWNYNLPIGRGQMLDTGNNAVNYIIGNWQWNGIVQFASGFPYNLAIPGDPANIGGNGYERPDLVGDPTPAHQTPSQWLNKAAFAEPAPYTFGNLRRDTLRTQAGQDFDMSLFRNFPMMEDRFNLQLRGEAFNIFNNVTFGQPGSTFGSSSFGVITSQANSPRTIQLAVKLLF